SANCPASPTPRSTAGTRQPVRPARSAESCSAPGAVGSCSCTCRRSARRRCGARSATCASSPSRRRPRARGSSTWAADEVATLPRMSNRELIVDGTRIADDTDCWVIAEIGHNHQGSLEQCKELFAEAARCGANAVKLQKRDNRGLYTREFFNRPYENENSYGPTYGQHREALEFGRAEYQELKAYAAGIGVTFFATAFDFTSAEMLADLDMPAYKIASGDLTNTPLLRFVAEIGKPMILSTGGGTLDDVRRAHDCVAELNPH